MSQIRGMKRAVDTRDIGLGSVSRDSRHGGDRCMDLSAIAASKRYVEARVYEPPCTSVYCESLFEGGYDAPLIVGLWRWNEHMIDVHVRPRTSVSSR